jgi:hypothetical protein
MRPTGPCRITPEAITRARSATGGSRVSYRGADRSVRFGPRSAPCPAQLIVMIPLASVTGEEFGSELGWGETGL